MNPLKVMYIDEDEGEIRQFKRKFIDVFEVETVDFSDIQFSNLIDKLSEKEFDYLIVDYHLNEKSGCGFDGDAVLIDFLRRFPHFPTMLLTNQDQGAIESVKGLDIEKVRSKKEYLSDELRPAFSARIIAKVEQYQNDIKEAEEKLEQLAQKRATDIGLSADEEDESIRLDDFLDEILDADARGIPKEVLTSTNDTRLGELLTKTDDLINRLKAYEDISQQ